MDVVARFRRPDAPALILVSNRDLVSPKLVPSIAIWLRSNDTAEAKFIASRGTAAGTGILSRTSSRGNPFPRAFQHVACAGASSISSSAHR
jgi:hypothetical protein